MADSGERVLVTGANGQIALQLFAQLARRGIAARAVVRSERAAALVEALPAAIRPEVTILDYADVEALVSAAADCDRAVHLVGIIKETPTASYEVAHERTCGALAEAAARSHLEGIVYLSLFGADPKAKNRCLASRGRAEAALLAGSVPVSIVRVPMVVGPDDPASRALRAQAQAKLVPLVAGGRTLQQPIDVRDVLRAIVACLEAGRAESLILDLGGPESLAHRELVARAAALYGTSPRVLPVPLFLVRALAAAMERLSGSPPITPSMLGVLQHDDAVDSTPATEALGIELTPLDETLERYIGPETEE
jgi:uncharacterized protein YbjT (DUF2867 family)